MSKTPAAKIATTVPNLIRQSKASIPDPGVKPNSAGFCRGLLSRPAAAM